MRKLKQNTHHANEVSKSQSQSEPSPITHHTSETSNSHPQSGKQPILEQAVYTAEETQSILSISRSTFMRLVKKEVLRANKIGGQYRVLGRELLRLLLPAEEYDKVKSYVRNSGNVKGEK